MLTDTQGALPEALLAVRTRPLFTLWLDVRPMLPVRETPAANRRIGVVSRSFRGQAAIRRVLDGGSHWQGLHADGDVALDVRLQREGPPRDGPFIML
jgi:hypothetical protein